MVHTEWTPSCEGTVPIRSTWRDAIGPRLTSRRISQLQREGWYGEDAKRRALSRDAAKHPTTNGIVTRCACGVAHDVRFLKWSYLPKSGYYCRKCVAVYRDAAKREKELARELRERAERALLERYV